MNLYIGIDLGTSALKGVLVDREGNIIKQACAEYAVSYPQPGWTEQSPKEWLTAMKEVLSELSAGVEAEIKGVSFDGQMHGLVALDKSGAVIRPCILLNDGRTEQQTDYLNTVIGRERLSALTGNIAFAGFTAPKLMWLRENEPENYARIAKIMLPKDYLAYKLTGVFSADYSDASGMARNIADIVRFLIVAFFIGTLLFTHQYPPTDRYGCPIRLPLHFPAYADRSGSQYAR